MRNARPWSDVWRRRNAGLGNALLSACCVTLSLLCDLSLSETQFPHLTGDCEEVIRPCLGKTFVYHEGLPGRAGERGLQRGRENQGGLCLALALPLPQAPLVADGSSGLWVGGERAAAKFLPPTPGRVTLSNVSERKDNMRLGLSLATNPKDNSFLVRATHPTLSPRPHLSCPMDPLLGARRGRG